MAKDDLLYFGHILDAARGACAALNGVSREAFDADENLRLAEAHRIQIIGEAARRVSPVGRAAHPEIPWHQITGMHHRIVLAYLNIQYSVVWEVVIRDLPNLIAAPEAFVQEPGSG
ncbi:MAG: DUF86 domain-containing protein [Chloroflexota bacterium]|nr:DUF86 domain-containing protein [Chloroflexota bacterium]